MKKGGADEVRQVRRHGLCGVFERGRWLKADWAIHIEQRWSEEPARIRARLGIRVASNRMVVAPAKTLEGDGGGQKSAGREE